MKKSFIILLCVGLFSHTAFSQATNYDAAFLSHLSRGDWQYVYSSINDTLTAESKSHPCVCSPVSRFILGHAAIVLGKNNLATNLFYAGCDSSGSRSLSVWMSFTTMFNQRYNSNVSQYLLADAYARNSHFYDAQSAIDSALVLNPSAVLCLNLRGVVTWMLSENDSTSYKDSLKLQATDDINKAIALDPRFADAFANKALFVLRNAGDLKSVRELTSTAFSIDTSFYLAQNTKAVSYGIEGKKELFEDTIAFIRYRSPSTPFINFRLVGSALSESIRGTKMSVEGNQAYVKLKVPEYKFDNGVSVSGFGEVDLTTNAGKAGLRVEIPLGANDRGGVFSPLKDGDNLVVTKDKSPVLIGAGFNFNYPNVVLNHTK